MNIPLEKMSLEALWKLFPIVLKTHDPLWVKQFEKERANLYSVLDSHNIRWIKHIGSSAIKTIYAKPIVDILVEFNEGISLNKSVESLKKEGYLIMHKEDQRISLNKGYTPKGYAKEVFHLHLRMFGDHSELYFRDYLIEFPKEAINYDALKKSLAKQYKYNRDAYTNQKTEYIQSITTKAKTHFNNKYE